MLKNYIRVIKTMSITCTVNLNCHKLSTEFIKLDYKWDFLNFLGKIWNIRVFALLSGAHYATGSGPRGTRGPSWDPFENKKLHFFYSGIHIGGRAPRARVGPKALLRAPVGPLASLGTPLGPLGPYPLYEFQNKKKSSFFLFCKGHQLGPLGPNPEA